MSERNGGSGLPDVQAMDGVPVERVPEVMAHLAALQARLAVRLTAPPAANGTGADQLLTLRETAARLGVPEGWVKKRPDLPFRVELSEGTVRYSERGLDAFIRTRRARNGAT